MALIIKDRVKEITTTTGTGAVSLGGASATFDAFQSVMSNGDTTFYAIVHTASGTDEWEVGLGTWNTGNTLTRTTVYAGSNGTSAVNFSSGNKDIFMTYPASKAAVAGEDVTFADVTATDITATGTVTLAGDPTSALQAATKEYVDTIAAAGIHYHTPVRVEAPSALTATYDNGTSGVGATLTNSGTQAALVIDGVTLSTSDRVLVYNQTNAAHNGVYTVTNTGSASTNWVLTRATDADSYGASDPDALGEGDAYFVKEGDTGAGELYVMNTSGTITFGTTAINFTVIAETAVYSAGTGLTLTGTTFSTNQDISTSASPTFAGATVNGNITVTGTVDGRDVATDGSKLDGIEAGATADQTAAEIKTAYESNSNTNAFTDAEKTKLSGIETGATGDQTASEILTAIKTVDGAASGLDADLLDGQQGSYYLNTSTSFSGDVSGTYNNIVVANDSHTHDGRYYTETEADSRFVNVTGDSMTGPLSITGNSSYVGSYGYSTLILQDGNGYPGIDFRSGSNDWLQRMQAGGDMQWAYRSGGNHTERMELTTGGSLYLNTNQRVFADNYHPNADKWTTARTLTLSGDASGSVSWDGSANATLSVAVANDSHTHTWSNIVGNTRQNYSLNFMPASSTNYAGFQFYTSGGSNAGYFLASGGSVNNTNYQPNGISLIADAGWLSLVSRTTTNTGVRIATGATTSTRMTISDAGDIDFTGSSFEYNGNTVWHAGNDGSGSGLDADTVDGYGTSTGSSTNTVVVRNASGYIFGNYYNGTGTFSTTGITSGMGLFTGTNGSDTYGRSYTAAAARALLNVENGATADQTASEILTAIKTVDGSGSGLDADTLDGYHESTFMRKDGNATLDMNNYNINYVSQLHFNDGVKFYDNGNNQYLTYRWDNSGGGGIQFYDGNGLIHGKVYGDGSGRFGLLDQDSHWAVQIQTGYDPLTLYCNNNPEFYVYDTYTYSPGSSRAPLFYDSNNTSYYANPAGNSRTNTEQTNYLGLGVAANTSGSYRLNMAGSIDMNGNDINYVSQLHFNDNVRFYDNGDDNYLIFKWGDTSYGGMKFLDGSGDTNGYIYSNGNGDFGLLDRDGHWFLYTNGTSETQLRANNNTELYVFTTYVYAAGSFRAPVFYDSNNTLYYSNQAGTSVYNQINVATLNTTSDKRFKSDLVKIDNAVDKVKAINGYTYMLDGNDDRKGGLIAQEVEEVLPEAVKGDDYKKLLDYNATIALLVEAVKEQQEQIDALKKQLNS